MTTQKYNSANTSINKNRLPAIYSYPISAGVTVLDYGCGRYTDHIKEYAEVKGVYWTGYDKYNQPEKNNTQALSREYDIVLCSNVLNVIEEDEIVKSIIRECVRLAEKEAVFTVYEGNGTGIGRASSETSYQRNWKLSEYMRLMENMGLCPIKKGKFIIIRK